MILSSKRPRTLVAFLYLDIFPFLAKDQHYSDDIRSEGNIIMML